MTQIAIQPPSPTAADDALSRRHVPLCVDLDGSLVATDTLVESLLLLVKHKPLAALRFPLWLMGGKAHMKQQVASHVQLNAASLPYREGLVDFVKQQRDAGRQIVLATAADQSIARGVAEHLGLFDEVLASDGTTNLSSERKLKAITESCNGAFDYVGNSHDDLALWAKADRSYVVAPSAGVMRRMKAVCSSQTVFDGGKGEWLQQGRAMVKALRPHQWAKNVLLAVPLVTAHQLGNVQALMAVAVAFVAFSAAASSVYLVNDLLDLEADRLHPTKRRRPFAAGDLPASYGIVMTPVLLAIAFTLASLLSWKVAAMVVSYVAISTTYSLYLKRKLLVDVFALAGLYTHRILTGAVAIGVAVTPWLLAFSMFLFISLAFAKRFIELRMVRLGRGKSAKGRGYVVEDLEIFSSVGPASGYIAVLVFCLYINSDAVLKLYRHPEILWLACPPLLYWVTRLWFLAHRGELPDDPVKFALKDKASYVVAAVVFLTVAAATIL
jgi:4-hydroxybenzoate polyprenyltransferase